MSTRYTKEFRDRAVRLLAGSRENYSSQTQALAGVARDPGVSMESLRRWRANADASVGDPGESAELRKLRKENAELRRANGILSSPVGFFRLKARPDTALIESRILTRIVPGMGSGRSAGRSDPRWTAGSSPPEPTGRRNIVPPV